MKLTKILESEVNPQDKEIILSLVKSFKNKWTSQLHFDWQKHQQRIFEQNSFSKVWTYIPLLTHDLYYEVAIYCQLYCPFFKHFFLENFSNTPIPIIEKCT